jgi:antitoxin component of MazEF toxin-antitoxin module
MPETRQIGRTGNSLTVTLPRSILLELQLRQGDLLAFDLGKRHTIVLSPYRRHSDGKLKRL